jgi:hypothetical protein
LADDPTRLLQLTAAELVLDLISAEEAVARAADLVTAFPSNVALAEFAGMTPTREAAWSMLASALDAAGLAMPTPMDAGRTVALAACQRIDDGSVTPYDGARLIWSRVIERVPELRSEFGHFAGLASEWQDDEEHRGDYEADIRAAAKHMTGG